VRRRPTTIAGDLNTLRDYVFCEDIARFMVDRLLTGGVGTDTCSLLCSGKCSSIGEVLRHVEGTVGRKAFVNFVRQPSNGRDICPGWREQPVSGWRPVDLQTGIRAIHNRWKIDGYWLGSAGVDFPVAARGVSAAPV
jgi:hypothetical protein